MSAENSLREKGQQINTAALIKSLTGVKHEVIRQSGERFCASLELVNLMLLLPTTFLALMHLERSIAFYETKARILATLRRSQEDDFEEQYEKELARVLEVEFIPATQRIAEQAVESGKHAFADMLEHNRIRLRDTYDTLLYSGTVWIWCSFEVLMRELWEYALNKGGKHLGGAVTSKLPSRDQAGDKIKGKFISLDWLARFDYDLSRNLGTALLDKFDFTSCKGIREAYSYAFPRSKDIKAALCRKELHNLEAARHVIVHNAGVIDPDFCRRTQTSDTDIGRRLTLSDQNVSDYGNAVIAVGAVIVPAILSHLKYASKAASRK